jgi:uncharacterized protein (UPF0548 family)
VKLVVPLATRTVRTTLDRAASASPTYDGPDVRLLEAPPEGFALARYDAAVGRGRSDFDRACEGLRNWATHRVPGVRIHPASTPINVGSVYVVMLGTPLLAIAAPCKVTRVTDESDHVGFSYRTLPGHPERGEEAFDVRLDESEVVHLDIVVVSQHAGAAMRLAGPAARLIQRAITAAYVRALRDAVGAQPA